jgi:hypothetical protein
MRVKSLNQRRLTDVSSLRQKIGRQNFPRQTPKIPLEIYFLNRQGAAFVHGGFS